MHCIGSSVAAITPNTQRKAKMKPKCECTDKGCTCKGKCTNNAAACLSRVDMEDRTGTLFCRACAEDAMESGLFTENVRAWIAATRKATR
jgi:hypothetical protein